MIQKGLDKTSLWQGQHMQNRKSVSVYYEVKINQNFSPYTLNFTFLQMGLRPNLGFIFLLITHHKYNLLYYRFVPGMRIPLRLTADYNILSWVDDVILGGLVSYGRWLRHWRRSERRGHLMVTFAASLSHFLLLYWRHKQSLPITCKPTPLIKPDVLFTDRETEAEQCVQHHKRMQKVQVHCILL